MEEVRSMWCDVLEELLQCPVCLETVPTVTGQCTNGHHICITCKNRVTSCPLCKGLFINTRNLAVEQISSKLEEIKLSLLHPYHALNKRILTGKVCVATQTEIAGIPSSTSCVSASCQTESVIKKYLPQNESQQDQKQQVPILSPKVGKGQYPCRIGSCTVELPHGRMIGHLRYYHKNSFYEFSNKSNMFKQTWDFEYMTHDYNFAFFIRGMGLFFLHLSIDRVKTVKGSVQIVNCNEAARQFTYTLKVGSGPQGIRYSAMVNSCRTQRDSAENYLHVHDVNMRRIVHNNQFRCELTINRKHERRTNNVQESPALNDTRNLRRALNSMMI